MPLACPPEAAPSSRPHRYKKLVGMTWLAGLAAAAPCWGPRGELLAERPGLLATVGSWGGKPREQAQEGWELQGDTHPTALDWVLASGWWPAQSGLQTSCLPLCGWELAEVTCAEESCPGGPMPAESIVSGRKWASGRAGGEHPTPPLAGAQASPSHCWPHMSAGTEPLPPPLKGITPRPGPAVPASAAVWTQVLAAWRSACVHPVCAHCRTLPKSYMEKIVGNIRTHNIHALLVIGGFEVRALQGTRAGRGLRSVCSAGNPVCREVHGPAGRMGATGFSVASQSLMMPATGCWWGGRRGMEGRGR